MLNRLSKGSIGLLGFVALNGIFALAGLVASWPIRTSQVRIDLSGNPSPLGYFFSLILFLLPCGLFGAWLWRFLRPGPRQVAFCWTLVLLFPLGVILDILFGKLFLKFPNNAASISSKFKLLLLPALDLGTLTWSPYIPIEEIIFYATGFTAILLTYIWADVVLFGEDRLDPPPATFTLLKTWPRSVAVWLAVGAAMFGLAFLTCRSFNPEPGAFPGYFLFLLVTAVVPSMVCFRVANRYLNWKALIVAWLFLLSVSQFWEATMGVPYGWWDYEKSQMMGVFIRAQCDLPVEAILVWSLAAWTTVMVYETVLAAVLFRGDNRPAKRLVTNLDEAIPRLTELHHRLASDTRQQRQQDTDR